MEAFNFARYTSYKRGTVEPSLQTHVDNNELTDTPFTLKPYSTEQLKEWQHNSVTKETLGYNPEQNKSKHVELYKVLRECIQSQRLPPVDNNWHIDNSLIPPTPPSTLQTNGVEDASGKHGELDNT